MDINWILIITALTGFLGMIYKIWQRMTEVETMLHELEKRVMLRTEVYETIDHEIQMVKEVARENKQDITDHINRLEAKLDKLLEKFHCQ
jgi:tRNA A58 N-methylase Trm61